MVYRAATPADEPFLREMLWLAYNWRDESAAKDHWPDPDGPRRYRRLGHARRPPAELAGRTGYPVGS